MHRATKEGDATGEEQESIEFTGHRVYLKVNCDFREDMKLNQTWRMKDEAYFYYSLDGEKWNQIGDTLKMKYDWPDFMGYRFGLFYFSTENCGGYVDFDYFHVAPVDGKKAELQKMIDKAEKLNRTPDCTDSEWNELIEAIVKAKETLPALFDNEDEIPLTEVEENNNKCGVYSVFYKLNTAYETVKNAKPTADANDNNNNQNNPQPIQVPVNNSNSAADTGASNNQPATTSISVKVAGYTLKGDTLYIAKGKKQS